MSYRLLEGLIHNYELGLIYVASTCSAHCRFCYREELIVRKDVPRPDGAMAPKGLAKIDEICNYIREFNEAVAANGGLHPESGRERLREILMSGGDPMVLGNRKIAEWWSALSEAEIENIRPETKSWRSSLIVLTMRFSKWWIDSTNYVVFKQYRSAGAAGNKRQDCDRRAKSRSDLVQFL